MSESKVNSSIQIKVSLDEKKIPEAINWLASDSPMKDFEECKAFMLSIWDKTQKNTLKIDLWTKEMQVDEMNYFFFQTLMTMADTYKRATNNVETAKMFAEFAKQFAEKTAIGKKPL